MHGNALSGGQTLLYSVPKVKILIKAPPLPQRVFQNVLLMMLVCSQAGKLFDPFSRRNAEFGQIMLMIAEGPLRSGDSRGALVPAWTAGALRSTRLSAVKYLHPVLLPSISPQEKPGLSNVQLSLPHG